MNKIIPALLILSSTASFAATIQLSGIRDLNDTAVVSNESLSGNVYSFSIQNTAPAGIIANVGLSFGNTLRLSSFTTSAPFQYNIQNNTVAPDFNFPLDFAMAGADQTKGLMPGESENFTWILTKADGTPVSGISAMDIAQHQVVRFRLLPTATGTDLALGPSAAVPEPATGAIAGVALLVMVMAGWRIRAKEELTWAHPTLWIYDVPSLRQLRPRGSRSAPTGFQIETFLLEPLNNDVSSGRLRWRSASRLSSEGTTFKPALATWRWGCSRQTQSRVITN